MSTRFQILALMRRQPRKWKSYDIASALSMDTVYVREQLKAMHADGLVDCEVKRERSYFLREEAFAEVDAQAERTAKSRSMELIHRAPLTGYDAAMARRVRMAMETRR